MKTAQERQEEKRQEKFAEMQELIKSGKLVVRKMTAEERKRFPPRPAKPKKRSR